MTDALIPVLQVQKDGWKDLIEKYGLGKAGRRYVYSVDCTYARFPSYRVLQGPSPSGFGFTDSGSLANENGEVVGGVDAINR